jgi:hypothetical protein
LLIVERCGAVTLLFIGEFLLSLLIVTLFVPLLLCLFDVTVVAVGTIVDGILLLGMMTFR